jgi:hypothetical protein
MTQTRHRHLIARDGQSSRSSRVRVPHVAKARADAHVSLNDGPVMAVGVSRTWNTHVVRLDADQTKGGLDQLDIAWPEAIDSDEAIEHGARRLERWFFPGVLPSCGDLHALMACRSNETVAEPA